MQNGMVEVSSARTVARNTSVQAIAEVLGKVATLALFVVMARELGQEGFGDFTFALSLALMTTVFAGFGIDQVIARTVARDAASAPRLLGDALIVKIGFGLLGVAVAMAIAFAGGYDADVKVAVGVLAVAAVTEIVTKIFHSTFQGLDDMRPVAVAFLIQRYFFVLAGVALLLAGAGVVAMALAYLMGALLAQLFIALRLARRSIRPEAPISAAGARALVRTSLALGITLMLNTVLFRVDATLLSLIEGNADVGIYGAAYRLLESTLFISYAFATALLPTLARLSGARLRETYEVGMKLVTAALLPLGTVFVLFAEPIVDLLYSDEYAAAVGPTRLLGGAAALYGVTYLASHVLVAHNRHLAAVAWATGGVLVVNVVLNLILIPHYSYDAAAAVTSTSEVLLAVAVLVFARRVAGPISLRRVLAGPVVGCLAIVAVAVLAGPNLVALVLAVPVYVAVVVGVERRLFPADVRLLLATVRRRPLADVTS
jgi:O-antigen/teichoic acid export membrane protein